MVKSGGRVFADGHPVMLRPPGLADSVFGTDAANLMAVRKHLPAFRKSAARVGLAPTPNGLTDRRATLTLPGKNRGTAGRISTCISPLRRRMPCMFGHGSVKWSEWQDFHLRPPGPKPGALKTELHSVKLADSKGLAPGGRPQGHPPADNGAFC
jgi:hypothetical protein